MAADPLSAQRAAYILVLIRALEKRAIDGVLDDKMADHIEKLLGIGEPDPPGEAEYASWFPIRPRVDQADRIRETALRALGDGHRILVVGPELTVIAVNASQAADGRPDGVPVPASKTPPQDTPLPGKDDDAG